ATLNRLVNNYFLEIGLYLLALDASYNTINTFNNADILVCYKTINNYRKKIANAYLANIQKYFAEK
ncbi:3772_t:CDS:1, partial [Scutellospora calospora]